jgi:hypothetical protein
MNTIKTAIFAVTLLCPGLGMAGDFEGNKAMICASQLVNECLPGTACRMVTAQDVNLPNFFHVDVSNKVITGKHDGGIDASTPIERTEQLDGKLILQGADDGSSNVPDGAGWTMVINANSGSMLLTATGDGFVVVVSGACMVGS